MMIMMKVSKIIVWGAAFMPISFAALATGMLFSSYNLAVAKNPEESENLFNNTLMGFALIETFVFIGIILGVTIYFLM